MVQTDRASVDCACVIHGNGYDWVYVETLYNMLRRGLQDRIRFHVYTEAERDVPDYMIKHVLHEWPNISGPKRSWWYKLELFNAEHHSDNLLYFDLDTIIVRDITWITKLSTAKMWTIRDFRYLQEPNFTGMNSSIMWWNVPKYNRIWEEFKNTDKTHLFTQYPKGDQQYLTEKLGVNEIRFFPDERIQSWRWQAWDGGLNFKTREQNTPGTGTKIADTASILVFHGQPKPHELLDDVVVKQHWI